MWLKHVLENVVRGENQHDTNQKDGQRNGQEGIPVLVGPPGQPGKCKKAQPQEDIQRLHLQDETPEVVVILVRSGHPHPCRQPIHPGIHQRAEPVMEKGKEAHQQHNPAADEQTLPTPGRRAHRYVAKDQEAHQNQDRPVGTKGQGTDKQADDKTDTAQPPT